MGLTFEVGLAIQSGMVAGSAQDFGENLLVPIEAIPVVHEAIDVAVFATHDDGAGRAADRVGAEGIFKEHAVGGQLVDFWGRVDGFEPAVVGSDGVGGMVVGEEEDNVGFLCVADRDERN